MKALAVIIVIVFVSLTSFAQRVQIIEEELGEGPVGMKYDGGMEPSCCYETENHVDAKFPSIEDVKEHGVLDKIWSKIQDDEEERETSFLIKNDIEDTAHLIRNDVYEDQA